MLMLVERPHCSSVTSSDGFVSGFHNDERLTVLLENNLEFSVLPAMSWRVCLIVNKVRWIVWLRNEDFLQALSFSPVPKAHFTIRLRCCRHSSDITSSLSCSFSRFVSVKIDRNQIISSCWSIASPCWWKGQCVNFMAMLNQVNFLVAHEVINNNHATWSICHYRLRGVHYWDTRTSHNIQ